MSYARLYDAWKREKESSELQPLDPEFYAQVSQYVKQQREDLQLLDEKTLKARLLAEEQDRVKKLLADLLVLRYRKMVHSVLNGKPVPPAFLTVEEEVSYRGVAAAWTHVEDVLKDVLRGRRPAVRDEQLVEQPKRILVRFLQAIPAIIGPDMQAYGPFNEEDVASLPVENADILVKRGIVTEVSTP